MEKLSKKLSAETVDEGEVQLSDAEIAAVKAMVAESSFKDVAEKMRVSEGTLKSLVAGARGRRSTVTVVRAGIGKV